MASGPELPSRPEDSIEWLDDRRGLAFAAGRTHMVYALVDESGAWVHWQGRTYKLAAPRRRSRSGPAALDSTLAGTLRSPMPGTVRSLRVALGERIPPGHVAVVIEAMKMEHELRAPWPARVATVHCFEGQPVEAEAPLVDLVPDDQLPEQGEARGAGETPEGGR